MEDSDIIMPKATIANAESVNKYKEYKEIPLQYRNYGKAMRAYQNINGITNLNDIQVNTNEYASYGYRKS